MGKGTQVPQAGANHERMGTPPAVAIEILLQQYIRVGIEQKGRNARELHPTGSIEPEARWAL
jgi:hypothetical protein